MKRSNAITKAFILAIATIVATDFLIGVPTVPKTNATSNIQTNR